MTDSWREDVPEQVQNELEECFGQALDMATHLVGRNGEFFPLGAVLERGARQAAPFAVWDKALGEHPESRAVLDLLYAAAAARKESILAVAFACDVKLADGGDAVRVEVEHVEGPPLEIVVPYRRARFRRAVTLGQMSVSRGTRRM